MLMVALLGRMNKTYPYTLLGVVASLAAGGWSYHLYSLSSGPKAYGAIGGALAVDGFSTFLMVLTALGAVLALLFAEAFVYKVSSKGPEFVILILLASAGAMLMEAAEDLLVVFIGLEILSISLYVLVAYTTSRKLSKESSFKYFILGSFASALFLYGLALTYGATGSTNFGKIELFLASNTVPNNGVLLAGMTLIFVGLAFKVALVPFQLWTPDVYQGAPTTVTGFMSGVAKAAAFGGMLRIFYVAFHSLKSDWQPMVLVIAVVTLLVGAILGIVQRDAKRMLAYSSINHAGFILLGLYIATASSISASLYYLFAYTIMTSGTFGVISLIAHLEGRTELSVSLDSLRGMGRKNSKLALVLALFLLAQAGAPFTIGFLAKFSVLSSVIQAKDYLVGIVAMVSVVIAAGIYLRIAFSLYAPVGAERDRGSVPVEGLDPSVAMFGALDTETQEEGVGAVDVMIGSHPKAPVVSVLAISLSLAMTIGFGLFASPLLHMAARAIPLH